ncbi:MAG: hypothetical protein EBV06_11535 [Planctomycetia bacterium]|nr:hypothetical protein [Planctomycetia bacterium]
MFGRNMPGKRAFELLAIRLVILAIAIISLITTLIVGIVIETGCQVLDAIHRHSTSTKTHQVIHNPKLGDERNLGDTQN